DLDRITRQQDFIRRMMKKAISSGLGNPLTLNRLVNIGVSNLTVDQTMSTKDITTVARKFRSINPDSIDMLTLPTTDAYIGAATGDADTYSYNQTIVRYAPGRQDKAALLKNSLSAGAIIQSDPTLVNADVALILGADYAGLHLTGSSSTLPAGATGASSAPAG